ncbi:MAG: hypothetical protein GY941_11470 [Planctomycetes bacterium]|nr:hypothetical protein [Planctomycetota bacterium]
MCNKVREVEKRKNQMDYQYNDGGRLSHGFKGAAGDCVCRAIAIASGVPYSEVYNRLAEETANQRKTKHKGKRPKSARNGINTKRKWFKDYMAELGFMWVPTMHIGQGCKVHLCANELPTGNLIISVSKHYTSMIDGVIHDTFNPSRDGQRCVYGYWQ